MITRFLDLLVLLGALQGLIVGIILLVSARQNRANRLLGILLLLMSAASLNIYLINQSWFNENALLNLVHELVPLVIFMPAGPLIYFYTRTALDPHFQLSKKHRVHFFPVVLDLFPHALVLFYLLAILTGLLRPGNPAWGRFIDHYNTYVDIPRWISLAVYLFMTYRYILSLQKKSGSLRIRFLAWPMVLVPAFGLFLLVWLLHLVPYIIPSLSERMLDLVGWYPIYIPGSVLIYWLSIKSYPLIQQKSGFSKKAQGTLERLSAGEVEEAIRRLRNSMEKEQLFLNAALNLQKLSSHTGLSPKVISAVLNQELHYGFSEFVNEYRIREIKSRILDPANKDFTITGIAYDCGFNSQPTFQRAFKNFTGLTPTEFIDQSLQNRK